ncbi:hydrogenase subunit MbhD domain-containing protein [Pyrococcus yayanosii]|uniref:Putative monovalent cation/H+ antiporter subunit B n=1 Tax=Pyrococcus yayanosii (strain CH1 / JCM 16557) TaxID=529709 RepID=F8AIU0_PYRYC|nr:hydrogenase subunit MbhD domain-containing protein [Pyrococcus yayanosii]AEH24323.1 putative monovalent cation/H+ antiporter subunit B [Pyrococcus yayanosii CH1]
MLGTILEGTLILLALFVILHSKILPALVAYSLAGLSFILLLILLRAPDVALSAIVVGALVIGLFIFAHESVREEGGLRLFLALAVIPLCLFLLTLEYRVAPGGSYAYYLVNWRMNNLVTEILASWRLYDSVGEALLLFAASLGFSAVLGGGRR